MYSYSSLDITVIIPVHNSGESCIKSIESIFSQSCSVAEIIIIDDGSVDGSANKINEYFINPKIPIRIFSILNRGAAGARNFGIWEVKTKLVAFLDSDDCWFPHKTDLQLRYFNDNPKLSLIGGLTNMSNFSLFNSLNNKHFLKISIHHLLFKNYFQTSTIIVKTDDLIMCGGFPEGRRYAEEGDLFMKIAAKRECILINDTIVDYSGGKAGFGVSGLSANLWEMELGELRNIIAVWIRHDAGILIIIAALFFSIIKFIRRLLLLKLNVKYIFWK